MTSQNNDSKTKIYPLTDADIKELIDYAAAEDATACVRNICERIKKNAPVLPSVDREKFGAFLNAEKERLAFDKKTGQWKPRHLIRVHDRPRLDLVDEMIGELCAGNFDYGGRL